MDSDNQPSRTIKNPMLFVVLILFIAATLTAFGLVASRLDKQFQAERKVKETERIAKQETQRRENQKRIEEERARRLQQPPTAPPPSYQQNNSLQPINTTCLPLYGRPSPG